MEHCSSILLNFTGFVNRGDISLKNLRILKNHKQRFFEVLEIIQPGDEINELKNKFKQILKDYDDFKEVQKILQYIGDFLQNLPAALGM